MKDAGLSALFGIVLVGAMIVGVVWFLFGGEKEGYINTSDCRANYEVEDQVWNRIWNEYTCTYRKTNAGQIMSGTCERVETTLFGNECKASYTYNKKPYKVCSQEYPWLGSDGKCRNSYEGTYNTIYAAPEE